MEQYVKFNLVIIGLKTIQNTLMLKLIDYTRKAKNQSSLSILASTYHMKSSKVKAFEWKGNYLQHTESSFWTAKKG